MCRGDDDDEENGTVLRALLCLGFSRACARYLVFALGTPSPKAHMHFLLSATCFRVPNQRLVQPS